MANIENPVIEIIPVLSVGDSAFDPATIHSSTLCIEIGEQNIRFCIVRDESLECVRLEDYAIEKGLGQEDVFNRLKQIFTTHRLWSGGNWKEVQIAVNTKLFTLVPMTYFNPANAKDYIGFAAGNAVSERDIVLHQELPLVHAHNVFTMPADWHEWFINHFKSAKVNFYHFTSPLTIGALVSHVEYQEVRIVSLYFEKDTFTMVISESQKLVLCNRFSFKEIQELAYIVLFALDRLGYDAAEIRVLCYGEITASSEVFQELAHFLPNIQLGTGPTTLKYSSQVAEVPGHRYFGLLNTYLVSS